MNHIAIDLGSRESQFCVRDEKGEILAERKIKNSLLPELFDCPKAVVIMETCSEAFAVADCARAKGHELRVVASTLARSLNVGARGIKTDKRDARALSEASCRIDLRSVHVPSSWSREVKSICGMREATVRARTVCINTVRGWLRTQLSVGRGTRSALASKLRAEFAAKGKTLPGHVERQLVTIEQLTNQIKAADADVKALAAANKTCVLLMTAPGVGPQTALRYVAALDTAARFPDAHQAESYLGITPGENSSSERKRITSITKAGSSDVRWLLVQAAWTALRYRPKDPMCVWAKRIAERRGKNIAVVALARKLAGVLWAIWRTGKPYDPTRNASPEVTPTQI